jgi:hypothetical protein
LKEAQHARTRLGLLEHETNRNMRDLRNSHTAKQSISFVVSIYRQQLINQAAAIVSTDRAHLPPISAIKSDENSIKADLSCWLFWRIMQSQLARTDPFGANQEFQHK